jgi:1,2-diacylglycerol 3-alpha-glucosyltransferase
MVGLHGVTMSKLERKPLVGSFHTLFTDSSVIKEYTIDSKMLSKHLIRYSWKYAKFFYGSCDEVIAPSGSIKSMLERRKIKNVKVVANGVDIKRFNPNVNGESIRKSITGNRRNEKVVMYVGRISKEKRLETLINAAKLMKDENVTFAFVGSGPAKAEYQNMVEKMHLQSRVQFLGFVDNKKLPEYYAACDAFCIPSTFETQGVVSLEAMACGKPVIGANYLALKELIKPGKNGEKFAPGNSGECAQKIRKVLYNIDSYKETIYTAKRYSIERTTDDLLDLYKRTINV